MTCAVLLSLLPADQSSLIAALTGQVENTPLLIFAALHFCIALACLAIWWSAPDYKVLLAMGLFFASVTGVQVYQYAGGTAYVGMFQIFTSALFVETAAAAMRIEDRKWTWFLWPLYIAIGLALINHFSVWNLIDWPILISEASLLVLCIQGFRHGNDRDRIVVSFFFSYFLVRFTLSTTLDRIFHLPFSLVIAGWNWRIAGVAMTFLGVATLSIVLRDLIRDRRERMRLSMEVEAARLVQQVLIPEAVPNVPGFTIDSVYKPFSEVGGDFFQILPTLDGGVLVVIGDVSGKGVPAAMTVSLLVGTVRTLAHYTHSPGEILTAMNQRMLGRSDGGFTTCLVLRADREGAIAIANAGHIAPFINGRELSVEGGLPLGLSADSSYTESKFMLDYDSQLTLLTDGVVEARNLAGELFGFERTAGIAAMPANTIADQAKGFGQNDDITVLTLVRSPLKEESTSAAAEPVMSPSIA